MKKILFIISIFVLSLFTLTSCGHQGGSYSKLSKAKSQTGQDYISFGMDGIVINNKYKTITYDKIFNEKKTEFIRIRQIDDYAYIIGKSEKNLCFAKYNLKNDEYVNYKFEYEKSNSLYGWVLDDGFLVVNFQINKTDILYYLDFDFNVTTQILTSDENVYSSSFADDKYGVFCEYLNIYEDDSHSYCINKILNTVFICYGNNIYKINIYINNLQYQSIREYIIDDYYVITGNDDILFLYNLKTNELVYTTNDQVTDDELIDLLRILSIKIISKKEEYPIYYPDIPSMPELENVDNYSSIKKIIKKYNNGSKIGFSYKKQGNDGNYYYIVNTYVEIYTFFPTDAGFSVSKELEPCYIFLYNKDENKISYVGYSYGELLFFYIR